MAPTKVKSLKQLAQLGLTALLLFPVLVTNAHAAHKEWYCKVTAFTSTYDAIGKSRAAAKLAATQKCSAENNSMHCRNVECEGPGGDTAVISSDDQSGDNLGWICKLTAFNKQYAASGNTRATAKLKVMRMCEMKHNKIFCEDPECEQG
jgi:hypothetical protein